MQLQASAGPQPFEWPPREFDLSCSAETEPGPQRYVVDCIYHVHSVPAEFLQTDLSDLKKVRVVASQISERYDRIDVMINNAGARYSHFEQTTDGIERTFVTNHRGHFLLTALILIEYWILVRLVSSQWDRVRTLVLALLLRGFFSVPTIIGN